MSISNKARTALQFLAASIAWLVLAIDLRANGLVTGQYYFEATYGPVCLYGIFPMTIGDMKTNCRLDTSVDAAGNVTATANLRTLKVPLTGTLASQDNNLVLQLHSNGHDGSQQPVTQIQLQRQGIQFIGTASNSDGTVDFTLDVSAADRLRVKFNLDLTVSEAGDVTGTGTATSCGVQVPVTVSGSSGDQVSLHIAGANTPEFVWDGSGSPNYTGFTANYTAKGFGVSTSGSGLMIQPKASAPALLANISTRLATQTGDDVLIAGFIITGTQSKKVMVRAIGPSLPVAGKLTDPQLELHDGTGAVIAGNDNWQDAANKQAIIDSAIAPSNDKEAAILTTLDPGAYTAIVSGVGGTIGVALAEVFDLDTTSDSRLANISTRGRVETGDNVMIGGFILLGSSPQRVLVRAIGPSLPVETKLADPLLELHDPNGGMLATNDNWVTNQPDEIVATKVPPSSVRESAIVSTLVPGGFTAIVRGVNDGTGVALVEVYGLGL